MWETMIIGADWIVGGIIWKQKDLKDQHLSWNSSEQHLRTTILEKDRILEKINLRQREY